MPTIQEINDAATSIGKALNDVDAKLTAPDVPHELTALYSNLDAIKDPSEADAALTALNTNEETKDSPLVKAFAHFIKWTKDHEAELAAWGVASAELKAATEAHAKSSATDPTFAATEQAVTAKSDALEKIAADMDPQFVVDLKGAADAFGPAADATIAEFKAKVEAKAKEAAKAEITVKQKAVEAELAAVNERILKMQDAQAEYATQMKNDETDIATYEANAKKFTDTVAHLDVEVPGDASFAAIKANVSAQHAQHVALITAAKEHHTALVELDAKSKAALGKAQLAKTAAENLLAAHVANIAHVDAGTPMVDTQALSEAQQKAHMAFVAADKELKDFHANPYPPAVDNLAKALEKAPAVEVAALESAETKEAITKADTARADHAAKMKDAIDTAAAKVTALTTRLATLEAAVTDIGHHLDDAKNNELPASKAKLDAVNADAKKLAEVASSIAVDVPGDADYTVDKGHFTTAHKLHADLVNAVKAHDEKLHAYVAHESTTLTAAEAAVKVGKDLLAVLEANVTALNAGKPTSDTTGVEKAFNAADATYEAKDKLAADASQAATEAKDAVTTAEAAAPADVNALLVTPQVTALVTKAKAHLEVLAKEKAAAEAAKAKEVAHHIKSIFG